MSADDAAEIAEAEALDAEIRELVRQERMGKYELVMRLGRMRGRGLWRWFEHASFPQYAVAVGAARSRRAARQLADLADQLERLPLLRALFASGDVHWTKIRAAAPGALLNPATEATWVAEALKSSHDEIQRKSQIARGLRPTVRNTTELECDLDALFHHLWNAVGEKRGVRLTKVEFMRLLLLTTMRVEAGLVPVPEGRADAEKAAIETALGTAVATAAQVDAEAVVAEAAAEEKDGKKRRRRREPREVRAAPVPGPSALFTIYECKVCAAKEVESPSGPVPLSPELEAGIASDVWVQDEEGRLTRRIPDRIRRRVYHRDRGRCQVPGCGARGFLHEHHQGGWRNVGHDEENLFLGCVGHHDMHHDGKLRIEGTTSTGRRFFDPSGVESVAPPPSTWTPPPVPTWATVDRPDALTLVRRVSGLPAALAKGLLARLRPA